MINILLIKRTCVYAIIANALVANRAPGGNLNLNDHSQRAVISDKVVVP